MKQRASIASLLSLILLLLAGGIAGAQGQDVYSERTLELSKKLACPVCDGQSIADSQARLAREMKQTIETQVQSGKSDEEIIDFFVARFGEEVLLEPPREGVNLALWWIPVVALLLGALVVGLYLRDNLRPARRAAGPEPPTDEDAELEAIADDVLGDSQSGRNRPLNQGAE